MRMFVNSWVSLDDMCVIYLCFTCVAGFSSLDNFQKATGWTTKAVLLVYIKHERLEMSVNFVQERLAVIQTLMMCVILRKCLSGVLQ